MSVEVTVNGEDYTSDAVQFRYMPEATVSSVSPGSGPSSGGTLVAVYGSNVVDSELLVCRFGSSSVVSARWLSSSQV